MHSFQILSTLLVSGFLLLLCAGCEERVAFNQTRGFSSPNDPGGGFTPGNNRPGNMRCTSDDACTEGICCEGICVQRTVCDPGPCQAHGDECSISTPGAAQEVQGEFYCARIPSAPSPVCLQGCERSFSADGCPLETFCLAVSGGEENVTLCLPGECNDSEDCSGVSSNGGTCLFFGNQAGFCIAAGTLEQGEECGAATGDQCASDLYCVEVSEGVQFCQPLCDMWQKEEPCERGMTCGYLTGGTGVCRPQTTTGREIAEDCDPEGSWCSSGVQCFDFQTGGESKPVCAAWCRPGKEDCKGRFQDQQGFCRTVFSDGSGEPIEDFGLCL